MSVALDSNMLFMPYSFLPQYCALFGQKEAEPALSLGGTSAKEENILALIVFDQQEEQVVSSELVRNVEVKHSFWSTL